MREKVGKLEEEDPRIEPETKPRFGANKSSTESILSTIYHDLFKFSRLLFQRPPRLCNRLDLGRSTSIECYIRTKWIKAALSIHYLYVSFIRKSF